MRAAAETLRVGSEISWGDPGSFESERATRTARYASLTLGTLVKTLCSDGVVPDADDPGPPADEDEIATCSPGSSCPD